MRKWRKADKPVGSPASDHRLIRQTWGLTGQWPQTNQQAAESQPETLSQNKKRATPEDHMRLISHLCTNMESQQNISIGSSRILGEFRQIFDTLTRLKEYRDQGSPNSEVLGNYHEFSLRLWRATVQKKLWSRNRRAFVGNYKKSSCQSLPVFIALHDLEFQWL